MTARKPKWFSNDKVLVSTAPTCGLTKGGRFLALVDPATGLRVQTVDPETGEQVDAVNDALLADMEALRDGKTTDTLGFIPAGSVSLRHAVPVYYDRRYDESQLHRAPRALVEEELRGHLEEDADGWRYRYTQAAVVTAYAEMATAPPAFADVRIRTLLVLGADSYVPYDHLMDAHREALGDLLEVVTVPGGHTVLWDALDETASAIAAFLGEP